MQPVGIIANPMSGRDVRRYAARGSHVTLESKRDQVARAVIGAAAAGAERVLVMREPFAISVRAVENLRIPAEIEVLELETKLDASDTRRAVEAMRAAGCGALVVLGGDGTNRAVARAWRDAPIVPLSTGTNNVFPRMAEATIGGAAAGLVAAQRVPLADVSQPAKLVLVEIDDEDPDLAVVDAVFLRGDRVGNFMPFEPERIQRAVFARAEPAAVGNTPIGGLLIPSGAADDYGVVVGCVPHAAGGKPLLVPISPGLYRKVHVAEARELALGEEVSVEGPGVLALDGDRERELVAGQQARLRVERSGPQVIDIEQTLRRAAREGLFLDRPAWSDAYDGAWSSSSCC
jgi:hypothetical protein